jgi:peptidoglycan/xylan/chitin deacetylase (PgdA/CDA1 family)
MTRVSARLLRELGRDAMGAAVHWTGAGRAFEAAARPAGAIILMYHSVAQDAEAKFIEPANHIPPPLFERQMAFLCEHRRVVPLSRLVDDIAAGKSPPAGTVCITFDDGYRDNLTVAAPILEKYRLPATLFVATGYVERGENQWSDTLHWLFTHAAQEIMSRTALHAKLLEASHGDRIALLEEIRRKLVAGMPPRLGLDWDEARQLLRRYPLFEIGGHTRDHLDLTKHRGEARAQIDGCAEDLRRELGIEPRHFSYPYERWCPETRAAVIASGWASAVGTGPDVRIGRESDRFAMPRVEAPRSMTQLGFKTSGAYPGALNLLGLS